MGARHRFQDCMGSGILSNIIYFWEKNQAVETTTLRRVHLHPSFVGRRLGPGQSFKPPPGRCTCLPRRQRTQTQAMLILNLSFYFHAPIGLQ